MLPHSTRNLTKPQEPQPMPAPAEPTYVRHMHGNTVYKVLDLDAYSTVLQVHPNGYTHHIPRRYLAENFIAVDPPATAATYAKQQILAARAFLAAHAGSNYLRHPNNNHRSSMGICR